MTYTINNSNEPLDFVFGITEPDTAQSLYASATPYAREVSVIRSTNLSQIVNRIQGFEGLLHDDSKVVTVLEASETQGADFTVLDAISLVRTRIGDNHFAEIVLFDSKKSPPKVLAAVRQQYPEAIIVESNPEELSAKLNEALNRLVDSN